MSHLCAQAETVSQIESDVEAAHGRTETGVKQLVKAASYQKGGFKCVVIALAVLAGAISLVAFVFVLYTKYAMR
jgi:t-SNARE complex subunit (syntaxin)